MAGCPATRSMRLYAPLFVLTLLQLSGQLYATEASREAAGAPEPPEPPKPAPILPTRASIYQHLTAELGAAEGAGQHVQSVFAALADGLRDMVRHTVLASLQAFEDGVVQRAEDVWVAADDAGRAIDVKQCVDGAEGDAQQVTKRALEKVEGCIQAVEDEGQRRVRQATRLLGEIEDVSKRFVTALEECVKAEEAKDTDAATQTQVPSPADADAVADAVADADVPVTEQTPTKCPMAAAKAAEEAAAAAEKPAGCPKAKGSKTEGATGPDGVVEEDTTTKPKCKSCASGSKHKKSSEGDASKEESGEEISQEDSNQADKIDHVGSAAQKEGKSGKDYKEKKGKEWKDNKGKDKYGKQKKDSENVGTTVEEKGSEKSKDKSKNKNGKVGEAADKANKDGENADKKSKEADETKNSNAEETSGEVKDKKSKGKDKKEAKGKKDKGKEKGDESGEGKKSRKKRDLLALNESPEGDAQAQVAEAPAPNSQEEAAATSDPWPTEGSTPEERRVIACMRSPTLKLLVDEKTLAYQRLQAVLQRTAAKQNDAPVCVSDHMHKAELKIAAIKQRMASCAERKMHQEL